MAKNNIIILDDDKNVNTIIKEMLLSEIDTNIISFEDQKLFFQDESLLKASDMIIIDLVLKDQELQGKEVSEKLIEMGIKVPFLFISGYYESFFNEIPETHIFDFIKKPFEKEILLNRTKLLLKVSKTEKYFSEKTDNLRSMVFDLLNYSSLYVLILSNNLNIHMVNSTLVSSLEMDVDELKGKNLRDIISPHEKLLVEKAFEEIIKENQSYQEFMFYLVNVDKKKEIAAKWFCSFFNTQYNMMLCIGIPMRDDIFLVKDEGLIREYYKNIIRQDRKKIELIKGFVEGSDLKEKI